MLVFKQTYQTVRSLHLPTTSSGLLSSPPLRLLTRTFSFQVGRCEPGDGLRLHLPQILARRRDRHHVVSIAGSELVIQNFWSGDLEGDRTSPAFAPPFLVSGSGPKQLDKDRRSSWARDECVLSGVMPFHRLFTPPRRTDPPFVFPLGSRYRSLSSLLGCPVRRSFSTYPSLSSGLPIDSWSIIQPGLSHASCLFRLVTVASTSTIRRFVLLVPRFDQRTDVDLAIRSKRRFTRLKKQSSRGRPRCFTVCAKGPAQEAELRNQA
jgi:hypothetical protein